MFHPIYVYCKTAFSFKSQFEKMQKICYISKVSKGICNNIPKTNRKKEEKRKERRKKNTGKHGFCGGFPENTYIGGSRVKGSH